MSRIDIILTARGFTQKSIPMLNTPSPRRIVLRKRRGPRVELAYCLDKACCLICKNLEHTVTIYLKMMGINAKDHLVLL